VARRGGETAAAHVTAGPFTIHRAAFTLFGTVCVLNLIPARFFHKCAILKTLSASLKQWPSFATSSSKLQSVSDAFETKYLFCYLAIGITTIVLSLSFLVLAWHSARRQKKLIEVSLQRKVGPISAAVFLFLFLVQLFWVAKFPFGRSSTSLLVETLIWLGVMYSSTAFGVWLGFQFPIKKMLTSNSHTEQ
jgi:hypothetical protein